MSWYSNVLTRKAFRSEHIVFLYLFTKSILLKVLEPDLVSVGHVVHCSDVILVSVMGSVAKNDLLELMLFLLALLLKIKYFFLRVYYKVAIDLVIRIVCNPLVKTSHKEHLYMSIHFRSRLSWNCVNRDRWTVLDWGFWKIPHSLHLSRPFLETCSDKKSSNRSFLKL